MPNTAIWLSSNNAGPATTAATTQFENFSGTTAITTEFVTGMTCRNAGTFSHMYVRLSANSNSLSTTFTFRDGGVSKNETISVATTVTGDFEDAVNTDVAAAGDVVNMTSVPGAGTGTVTMMATSVLFNATDVSNTVTRIVSYNGGGVIFSTVGTFFNCLDGNLAATTNTVEGVCKARQRKAGTFKNLYQRFSTNGNSAAVTYQSRKNGGNGNLTISIAASNTGAVEDTTNSDTVVPGDDYNTTFITSGTVSFTPRQTGVEFISKDVFTQLSVGESASTALVITAGTTDWCAIGGRGRFLTATEANTQMKCRDIFYFSELTVVVTTNAATADSTLTFRKNAANGNMTVPITHGVTGAFSDSNNIDVGLPTDEVNTQIVCPTNGGITLGSISVWATAYRGQNFSFSNLKPMPLGQQRSPMFG